MSHPRRAGWALVRSVRRALGAGGLALCLAPALAAQGNCNVNNQSTCVVGGTTTYGMNVTISTVVRMQLASAIIPLGTATGAEFAAGFGAAIASPVTIRANRSWTVTLRATAATWTATGPAARLNKPVADLQWATAAAGPFTNLSTVQATIGTGNATAGQTVSLFVRPRYTWTLDTPGSYSLPLQLTITAP